MDEEWEVVYEGGTEDLQDVMQDVMDGTWYYVTAIVDEVEKRSGLRFREFTDATVILEWPHYREEVYYAVFENDVKKPVLVVKYTPSDSPTTVTVMVATVDYLLRKLRNDP